MHVPLNMGNVSNVSKRTSKTQEPHGYFVLSRDLSAMQGDHIFAVTDPVQLEEMTTLPRDFMTRVCDGPYRTAADWVHDMENTTKSSGHAPGRAVMFYASCPKRARACGKNYMVGVAETSAQSVELEGANDKSPDDQRAGTAERPH